MQDASSPGQTRRSGKSINLEANILSEWSGTTAELRQRIQVRLLALGATLVFGLVTIPQLNRLSDAATARATAAAVRNSQASRLATDSDRRAKAAQPLVQQAARQSESHANLDVLLGNMTLVVNAVPTSVAFDVLHAEVMDAELTITCKSQAESTTAGQAFVDAASKGPNVVYAVQASTMKSTVLADDGIAFDFIKRVNLEP